MLLRLTQHADTPPDWFRVEASLEDNGQRQTVTSRFQFTLSAQDREDLRWYLEDYGEYPFDPAPAIAARIEARIAEIGDLLFRGVFESSETARRLWARLSDRLDATRVEIVTEIREATAMPWELLRDPLTAEPLALAAQAFVRARPTSPRPQAARPVAARRRREQDPHPARDLPARAAATTCPSARSPAAPAQPQPRGAAISSSSTCCGRPPLSSSPRPCARPSAPASPTTSSISTATALPGPAGAGQDRRLLAPLDMTTLGAPRAGQHGYLLFENPQADEQASLVDGPSLGKLLVETGVPVLVLNACRSAFAEAPEQPADASASPQQQVAAFGSLAQEVMAAGVAGVVAMRYIVYVVTASAVRGRPVRRAGCRATRSARP